MTQIKTFNMEVTLRLLAEVTPADLERFSWGELEWILADFVISWGQRLQLEPATWPPPAERARVYRLGRRLLLPFAMMADFPNVTSDQIRTLALAVAPHILYILLLDEIIDAPETTPAAAKLTLQHLLFHSQQGYRALFPGDSLFWPEVEQRALRTTRAMWEEYYCHNGAIRPFGADKFRRIAADKVAIAQINPIALAILNDSPQLIAELTACWDAIALTLTILDDIADWQQDYKVSNFTYLLSQTLLSPPFQDSVNAGHLPTLQAVGAALFCSNLVESLYSLAVDELESAARRAQGIACSALADLIQWLLTVVQQEYDKFINRKLMALLIVA